MERPPGVPESFDVRTVVYLRSGANPPVLSEEDSTALHHAHLAHLAEQDPAVVAGRFRVDVARWAVAAGLIAFPQRDAPVGELVRFEDL